MKSYDVVVVGAGIIGLSTAWQLARRSNLSIAVIEKGAGLGEGSTGASSAVCRHRYSSDAMIELARDGISCYRKWNAFTGLSAPQAVFQPEGVLWMPGGDVCWAPRESERLRSFGIQAEVLDDAALREAFPALSTCTLAPDLETGEPHGCSGGGRHMLELDAGYMDPVLAAEDLRACCRAAGVDFTMRRRVVGVDTAGGRVAGVTLDCGTRLLTPNVVNAAGPWCRELFAAAGLEIRWSLVPTRIQIVYVDRPSALRGHIPVTCDIAGGIYFRTQNRGQQLVVGSILEEDERESVDDPECFQREIDSDFEITKLHLLQHRLPDFSYVGKVRGYCGLYTTNLEDVHPILGETELRGFWAANGFSGHGFKLAPAIGGLLASAITGQTAEGDSSIPMAAFSIDREPIPMTSRSVMA